MTLQDAQRLINWYCELSAVPHSKEPIALLGCPGLDPVISTIAGPVRGCWVLPGNQTALVVTGANVYLMTITVPATSTSIAQFAVTFVGTLLTNSGRVVIRDNGVAFGGKGGYAVLVDGTYGYFYRLAGAGTVSFTAALTTGSPTITPASGIPDGIVIGTGVTLTDTGAVIPGGTTIASVNFNSVTLTMSAAATGNSPTDTVTVNIPAFGQITDPAFLGADRIAFIEGWLIFNQPGTRTFYTNAATPYTLLFAASFYALKDSSTDNLVTLFENKRELWLIGERTSEVWFVQSGAAAKNFGFARVPGVGPQIGCAAKHSITRMGERLVWLAQNEQGQNTVVVTNQYSWETISNHAIEHQITSIPVESDALGDVYQEEGHTFYLITFPAGDLTLSFDEKNGLWHQRASFDVGAGVYHRHRANCFMNFADLRLVGDYTTGQIHRFSRSIYTDAGAVLRCTRRAPHVWDRESRKRVFQSSLQLEFTPGVGLSVGQGSDPQVMIRWSNDGGFTWSNEHLVGIGKIGQTKNRAILRRLGFARDRVWEASFSDPVARDIIGATLFGEAEAEEDAA
jgi:hypothetical protein